MCHCEFCEFYEFCDFCEFCDGCPFSCYLSFLFLAGMYACASHIGHKKLTILFQALKRGAPLKECAMILGLSISRTSRVVSALFDFVPVPKPGTVEYLNDTIKQMESEKNDVKEELEVMSNVIPFSPKKTA